MDMEKFTDRSRGFLQSAQTLAANLKHQQLKPEHLLKVLLDDEEGLAANLIAAAGGNADQALTAVTAELNRQPKVEGSGADQVYLSSESARVLDSAEQMAKKSGDSYVTVERILMALAMAAGTKASDILKAAKITAQTLNAAIEALRKGRKADSASAEEGYESLKKDTRDLTELARGGKIDPVIGRDD